MGRANATSAGPGSRIASAARQTERARGREPSSMWHMRVFSKVLPSGATLNCNSLADSTAALLGKPLHMTHNAAKGCVLCACTTQHDKETQHVDCDSGRMNLGRCMHAAVADVFAALRLAMQRQDMTAERSAPMQQLIRPMVCWQRAPSLGRVIMHCGEA